MTESRARPKYSDKDKCWKVAAEDPESVKRRWKPANDDQVSPELLAEILEGLREADAPARLSDEELDQRTIEVDVDFEKGSVKRVRRRGDTWAKKPRVSASDRVNEIVGKDPTSPGDTEFLNPYNFVPASARPDAGDSDQPLGDHAPRSHGIHAPGTWTGRIVVQATARTPLLFLDSPHATGVTIDKKVHRTYGVRVDADGRPVIPITGFKGALRSAFEAVTNSRLGVWSKEWDQALSYSQWDRSKRRSTRKDWPKSPRDLAQNANLLPAGGISELSPADRLFGWLGNSGSHSGQVRVRRIDCTEKNPANSIEEIIGGPIPLSILGKPKPTQGLFYLDVSREGEKSDYYTEDSGLRGRKFYWHHAGEPADSYKEYWLGGHRPEPSPYGWFNEFRHPGELRSDQNRSVSSWIKPGASFRVELDVINARPEELGGLLWLLSSDGGSRLRVGYGKPLGFGSLDLEIDTEATSLWSTGVDESANDLVQGRYSSLRTSPSVDTGSVIEKLVTSFVSATPAELLTSYLIMMTGRPGFRVHYPRIKIEGEGTPPPPSPDGENFKWFVENEKVGTDRRRSLPPADASNPSLPYYSGRRRRK